MEVSFDWNLKILGSSPSVGVLFYDALTIKVLLNNTNSLHAAEFYGRELKIDIRP